MKKIVCICFLITILCLTACKSPSPSPTETGETEIPTATLPPEAIDIFAPTEESVATTEPEEKAVLTVLERGTYSGVFTEDGSDRTVEKIPCLLIHNTTDQYLDYGVINAMIGEKNCRFVVTGIPGGSATWVMEETGQTMEAHETFTYIDQSVSQLRDLPKEERVQIRFLNGEIQATNLSDVAFSEIRIYYKRLHSDGNYLGGITYTTKGQDLQPGQTITLTAGHSTESDCAVVRVDCVE